MMISTSILGRFGYRQERGSLKGSPQCSMLGIPINDTSTNRWEIDDIQEESMHMDQIHTLVQQPFISATFAYERDIEWTITCYLVSSF